MTSKATMKAEGKKLEGEIAALGIRKVHFALLISRTNVCLSSYLAGRQPIPHWVWNELTSMKTQPLKHLRIRILALSPGARLAGLSREEQRQQFPEKA